MRLRSLDVFRGLTMAGMVIVNNPGDWNAVYAPLLHAAWHGWTPTDLIFPAFLFIVGASMALGAPERLVPATVLRRGAVLVALGLFLSGFPYFNPARWRIPGVLQRIGLCYVVAAFIWTWLARGRDRRPRPVGSPRPSRSVCSATGRSSRSCAAWRRGRRPHGRGQPGRRARPRGVWHAFVEDELGPRKACSVRYRPWARRSWGRAGVWIGRARPACMTPSLVIGGAAAMVVGKQWDVVFPINKSLWTSSYALFTGGVAMLVLGLLHRRLDDGRSTPMFDRLTEPFVALGRNALLLFVLSGLVAKVLIVVTVTTRDGAVLTLQRGLYRSIFASYAAPQVASLLYALTNLAALGALLMWLHRRRWYWSV